MGDFNNFNPANVSLNAAPTVRYMWVCETTQSLGTTSNYATPVYQQQTQTMYPFNMLHNSPVFSSQQNFNQRPLAFPESFQTQQAFWPQGNTIIHTPPSLVSPVTVTGYLVTNPQFPQNSTGNQGDELETNTADFTNQVFSTVNGPSQPVSFGLANTGDQHEHIWLQQQGQLSQDNLQLDQLLQNNHQQHDQILTNSLHQQSQRMVNSLQKQGQLPANSIHSDDQLEQSSHRQQGQQLTHSLQQQDQQLVNILQQDDQLMQSSYRRQDQLLQKNPHGQDQMLQISHHNQNQLLQNSHQRQDKLLQNITHQQEQTDALTNFSSQKADNENLTYYTTKHSSTENVNIKEDIMRVNGNLKDKIPELVKEAQWQEVRSNVRGAVDLGSTTLSSYFPTTLNPSLQINNPSRLKDPAAVHKSNNNKTISGPGFTLNESQIKRQDDSNGSELQLRRNDTQKNLVKEVYPKPRNKDDCIRCNTKVYPMERTGPIKDAVYHKRCFTCVSCGTTLNLKNFHHNPNEADDPRVFCASHRPKEKAHSCDANAVSIRSALTTPKLDKVNGQIRTDRHPSEVLARSGHSLQAASGLNTPQECFYYGMEVTDKVTNNVTSHVPQRSDTKEYLVEEPLEHVEDHQRQSQQVNEPLEQRQEELYQQLHKLEQTRHDQQHQLHVLVEHNNPLHDGIIENEGKLTDHVANITISEKDQTSPVKIDGQTNEVVLNAPQDILTAQNSKKDNQFSMSSSESFMLSSSRGQEITLEYKIESNLKTELLPDNINALQQQTQDVRNADEEQTFISRERLFSQSSIATSSRSISPMQVQTSFSFVEIEDGRKNSPSSDMSSRERSSFSSDLSSPGSNSSGSDVSYNEKVELGRRAKTAKPDQQKLLIQGVRIDRPSIHQYYHDLNTRGKAGSADKIAEKTTSNYSLDKSLSSSDLDRFLPKNERMRLDRPSQFSQEEK